MEQPAKLNLFAGSLGGTGALDGVGSAARLNGGFLSTDSSGNIYLIQQNVIRQILATGGVKTIAGSSHTTSDCGSSCMIDGIGAAARFSSAGVSATDSKGNIYAVDSGNIRKITPVGAVSTFIQHEIPKANTPNVPPIDGPIANAIFSYITHIASDAEDNIYVVDTYNNTFIRKISANGIVSTLNPDTTQDWHTEGPIKSAKFSLVRALKIDNTGNIYIAEGFYASCHGASCGSEGGSDIRKISVDGTVSLVVKDSHLEKVTNIALESSGSILFTAGECTGDFYNNLANCSLYRVNVTGLVEKIASNTQAVTIDKGGKIYTLGQEGTEISRLEGSTQFPIAGLRSHTGSTDGATATFDHPSGIASDSAGNLYVSDQLTNYNNQTLRKITPAGETTTLSKNLTYGFVGIGINSLGGIYGIASGNIVMSRTPDGGIYLLAGNSALSSPSPPLDGKGISASFSKLNGIAVDANDNVYVTDSTSTYDEGSAVRKIAPDGTVTTIAGNVMHKGADDGNGPNATFNYPTGIAIDKNGNIYVCDTQNQLIRKISPGGSVNTIAGTLGIRGANDGAALTASFNNPQGIAVDRNGTLFVADTDNHTIRKISTNGTVSTIIGKTGFAGVGIGLLPAGLSSPKALVVMPSGQLAIIGENSILVTTDGKF
jgi:sugar lactone lactonase YvrE